MIISYNGHTPQIAPDVFVAPNATIIGQVEIGPGSSVWFGAVIRGDSGLIRIGARVSVQDNVVIHVNGRHNTIIDDDITIGHAAVLEGCHVQSGALVGMNATVLDGSTIEAGAAVAAGSVVREGFVVPAGFLAAGVPAKIKGELTAEVRERMARAPEEYVKYAGSYMQQGIK